MPAQHVVKQVSVFVPEGKDGGHYETMDRIVASGPALPAQKKRPTRCGACRTEYKPLKDGNPKRRLREILDRGWVVDAEAMTLRCPSCASSQSPP